jgi:hypothetical protein
MRAGYVPEPGSIDLLNVQRALQAPEVDGVAEAIEQLQRIAHGALVDAARAAVIALNADRPGLQL